MSVAVTGFSFFNFGFYPAPSFIASSLSLFLWRNFHFLYGVERINLLGGKGHGQFIISLLKKKTLSSGSRRLCISYIAEAKSRSMTRQFSRRLMDGVKESDSPALASRSKISHRAIRETNSKGCNNHILRIRKLKRFLKKGFHDLTILSMCAFFLVK